MRTKTLVISALVGLAGSAAVMAQSVYSLNAVGYVNTVIPKGYSIIANPLNASTNTLSVLFPTAPENATIYKYNGSNFEIASYADNGTGTLAWDNDLTFQPGEAAWINTTTKFTNTFVGEVPTGTALTNAVPVGFSLKASIVPQAGLITTDLSYAATQGDTIYQYDNSISNFAISSYDDNGTGTIAWDAEPTIAVGEGFWLYTTKAKTWTRSFVLNK